jgi:cell wall-associated NlpC family hydrolase
MTRSPLGSLLVRGALLLAVAAVLAGFAVPAHADPDGLQPTDGVAAQIGQLNGQLNQADQDLKAASVAASVAIEHYERAVVDAQRAQTAYDAAQARTVIATRNVGTAEDQVGALARQDYEYGGNVGALAALVNGSPSHLMRNLSYLRYVGTRHAVALQGYRHAEAGAILRQADAQNKLTASNDAKAKAASAKTAAQQAVTDRQANVDTINARKTQLQQQLDQIEAHNAAVRQAAAEQAAREAAAAAEQRRQAAAAAAAAEGSGDNGSGDAQPVSYGSGDAMVAVRAALRQVGEPYVWDAADPDVGFDCSGLVLYAYEQIGVSLPHSAEYQYEQGWHPSSDELRPGDLLFYSYDGTVGGIHHVVMYIGNGMIVQAADFGIPVEVVPAYFDFGYIGATRLV